nr:stage II sporulation protein R [Peribacillus kribbensis]
MLKKHMAVIYLMMLVSGTILSLYMPKTESVRADEAVVIPGDAIRLRILANSDTESDQELKHKVRDAVNQEITKWVKDLTSKKEARKVISGHRKEIRQIAEKVVKEQGSTQTVKVKFGKAKFPAKLYGQYLYPAGSYEAIVVTLGDGEGANWWCVLYPPLCFLDFSNGTAVSQSPMNEEENSGQYAAAAEKTESQQDKIENKKQGTVQDPTESGHPEAAPAVQEDRDPAVKQADEPDDVQQTEKQPVYTPQDEEQVKVKFFMVEFFKDLF